VAKSGLGTRAYGPRIDFEYAYETLYLPVVKQLRQFSRQCQHRYSEAYHERTLVRRISNSIDHILREKVLQQFLGQMPLQMTKKWYQFPG